jgi:hypothetical protein
MVYAVPAFEGGDVGGVVDTIFDLHGSLYSKRPEKCVELTIDKHGLCHPLVCVIVLF